MLLRIGLASVDLATGVSATFKSSACGDSIAATSTAAVVGVIRTADANPNRRGKLLVVDPLRDSSRGMALLQVLGG